MVIIRILFIIAYYLFVLSPGRRVVGAWHVAVLAVLWPSAQRTQLALFVGRGERPERRERWNEEPPKVRRRS